MSECGCKIVDVPYVTSPRRIASQSIEYCPLHQAAGEMLDIMKIVTSMVCDSHGELVKRANRLIKRAEGK